jgi:hypothetical protein
MVTKIKPTGVDETLDFNFDEVRANSAIVSGSSNFLGTTNLQQLTEKIQTKTNATGTVEHDFSLGSVFYHTSPSANFTLNLTNVPVDNNKTSTIAVLIQQGIDAYFPTAFQIDGVAQTVKWSGGIAGSGTPLNLDIITFTLVRVSSSWIVFAQNAFFE